MNTNIPLRSSFRQPLRTFFLILLIGMTSFAFVSNAVQYLIVQRETGRLGSYYRSIGTLERLDGNDSGDVSQGASLITSSPYLAYEDRRKLSSGVMQDISTYELLLTVTNLNGLWFYGTLIDLQPVVKIGEQDAVPVGYALTFAVDQVLAGFPDDIQAGSGKAISLLFLFAGHEDAIPQIEAMQFGQRYLIRGWIDFNFKPDPNWAPPTSNFQLRALDDAGLWYLPVAAGAGVDFTVPGMARIQNDIDILNQNQHALMLIGTTDMSAMPQMQTASHIFYLADGRWLNHQDDLDGRRVIVIQSRFAAERKLEVGDSLTMTLRGLKDPMGSYIQGKDRENWRSYPTYSETFEIVGLYDDMMGGMNVGYAYIPNSVLPADAVFSFDILYPSLYSFVLDTSQHQESFINQTKDALANLGFRVNFVDNNGVAFWASVNPLRRSAFTGLVIYSLVLLIALVLAVFLYLSQRRKDYAICRALGVPKDRVDRQVVFPILLMGATGVLFGGIPAWSYALEKAAGSLSSIPTPAGVQPSAVLDPIVLVALCEGLLLLLTGLAWIGARTLGGRPVLELLGREALAKRRKAHPPVFRFDVDTAAKAGSIEPVAVEMPPTATPAGQRKPRSEKKGLFIEAGALAGFSLHHIRRSALKSALTGLVGLGLVVALGWMQWSIDRDRITVGHLYATTLVDAEIAEANPSITTSAGEGVIAQRAIDKVLASGFIQSAYTEAVDKVTAAATLADPTALLGVATTLIAFDQPEVYLAGLDTRDTLEFAPGWDESLFTKDWTADELQQGVPAVFPDSFLQTFDLKLGDKIYLIEESETFFPYLVAGQYTPGLWLLPGGIIKSQSEASVLLPLSALQLIQKNNVYYQTAKFVIDPARNRELPAFEQEMSTMISGSGAGRVPLKMHFWDEELRAVVAPLEKNLSLLQVLFPVTMAVSVLIGAGLCLLLALQQAKDVALLRMLGVAKSRVRILLSGGQLLLSLAGVLVGLGLLDIMRQNPGAVFGGLKIISAGLYLSGAFTGSLIGAIAVSNKKPLELLQVKE